MGKSATVVFLIVATAASVTNADVIWGVPPINLTVEGINAGFSGGEGDPPKYFYPEENQNYLGNLTGVLLLLLQFLSQIYQSLFSHAASFWHP